MSQLHCFVILSSKWCSVVLRESTPAVIGIYLLLHAVELFECFSFTTCSTGHNKIRRNIRTSRAHYCLTSSILLLRFDRLLLIAFLPFCQQKAGNQTTSQTDREKNMGDVNSRAGRVFPILCVIGLSAHVSLISIHYFAYVTSTKVAIDPGSTTHAPSLSFCVRYIDIMNHTKLQQKFNIKINETTPTFEKYYQQSGKLKVSDIFNNTPTGEEIVDSCMIRKANQNRRVLHSTKNKDECLRFFNITKYYMQSFICYRFMPPNSCSFTMDELAHSYNYEYSIYVLRLMAELAHAQSVFLMVYSGPLPYLSRSYGALRKTLATRNSDQRPNEYFAQSKSTLIKLQPPPYDTACDPNYDYASKSECITRKMQDERLDRVPNTEIITRPYDLPHVLHDDDDNDTFRSITDRVYEECNRKFNKSRCSYSIAETEVRMRADRRKDTSLRVRVLGPRGPNTHINSEPAFPLSEYLLYVSSCFGIWLGVSILRLNPVTLISILKQKHRKRWGQIHPNNTSESGVARSADASESLGQEVRPEKSRPKS